MSRPESRGGTSMGRLGVTGALLAWVAPALAEPADWDGAYTNAQADRGAEAYIAQCAQCHGTTLGGIEAAPALTGLEFFAKWEGETPGALAERTRLSMPPASAGSLSRAQSADLVAYVLRAGGYPAGATLLQTSAAPSAQTASAPGIRSTGNEARSASRPTGEEGSAEWRTYGGDLGHTRYSSLAQIDSSSFERLEVAWRLDRKSVV